MSFANFFETTVLHNNSKQISIHWAFQKISYPASCVKSVRIRSYSGPHFPAFRLNTDQNNSEYGHFLRSDTHQVYFKFTRKTSLHITFTKKFTSYSRFAADNQKNIYWNPVFSRLACLFVYLFIYLFIYLFVSRQCLTSIKKWLRKQVKWLNLIKIDSPVIINHSVLLLLGLSCILRYILLPEYRFCVGHVSTFHFLISHLNISKESACIRQSGNRFHIWDPYKL